MSVKTRKKQASKGVEETRAAFVQAGLKLFASKGFDGTSTRDLVEATGLNISLITYHFGGKEGLLDACLEAGAGHAIGAATQLLGQPETTEEFVKQLHFYVDCFLTALAKNPLYQKLVQKELDRNSPSFNRIVKKAYFVHYERLVEFFKLCRKRGLMREGVDPLTIAFSLNGALSQHMRLDRIRHGLFGDTLSDDAFRAKLGRDILAVFATGLCRPQA